MFDLLSTLPESMAMMDQVTPLTVHEDPEYGVYVKGLSCHLAQNEEEALNLLFEVSVSCHLAQNEEEALNILFEVSVSC